MKKKELKKELAVADANIEFLTKRLAKVENELDEALDNLEKFSDAFELLQDKNQQLQKNVGAVVIPLDADQAEMYLKKCLAE